MRKKQVNPRKLGKRPEVVTGKSSTTTIIGCGSASGIIIPPYFVFPGARMRNDLLSGATPGTDGQVSDSGWSNAEIFRKYLTEHLVKFLPGGDQYILLLLDGHKTHISVWLIEWAKDHKIILFILPAHTSHVLQPLDVACYGPLQKIYNNLCHKQMRKSVSVITRYNVCELGCKAYNHALTPENLQAAFKRTGIFPYNKNSIDRKLLEPADVFRRTGSVQGAETENGSRCENMNERGDTEEEMEVSESGESFFSRHESELVRVKSKTETIKKSRKCLSRVVSGKAITEDDVEQNVRDHIMSVKYNSKTAKESKTKKQNKGKSGKSAKRITNAKQKCKKVTDERDSQVAGPSHLYISEDTDINYSSDEEITEAEKCCVCQKFTPDVVRNSNILMFTNWGQCDLCDHWVHLKFCSKVVAIRRDTVFKCIHCEN